MDPEGLFRVIYQQGTDGINAFAAVVGALPVPYAFGAGMLATANPCGFIMLPAFVAFFLSGTTPDSARTHERLGNALRMGLLVTLAFVAVFTVIGAVVWAGGRFVMQWTDWAGMLVGAALASFGLFQIMARRSLLAGWTSQVRIRPAATSSGALLFGTGYAIASLGCTLPVFLVVAGSVFVGNRDFGEAMTRFVEYSLGMGAVLTALAVGVALARDQGVRLIGRAVPLMEPLANGALVIAGLYIVWYWVTFGDTL